MGKPVLIGGTSAASPTFTGIVSLLNDARIAAGKPPLGFLNPLIYSKGTKAFNDITIGSNPGCGTEGFKCGVGWDAGSFKKMFCRITHHSYYLHSDWAGHPQFWSAHGYRAQELAQHVLFHYFFSPWNISIDTRHVRYDCTHV